MLVHPTSIKKSDKSKKPKRREKGQAISEYGAVLAFVAILAALSFSFSGGSLGPAISKAFSTIASELEEMADTASSAS